MWRLTIHQTYTLPLMKRHTSFNNVPAFGSLVVWVQSVIRMSVRQTP
jgi:hypothetical protein